MAAASELLLEEIIMNILMRLPVKSLVRFKCVCKSWRSLINDPYFIRNQVNHVNSMDTSMDNGCERQIFTIDVSSYTTFHCMEIYKRGEEECDHQDHTNGDTPIVISVKDLDCRWYFECSNTVEIRGCCDGLLCLVDNCDYGVLIWNPSINECKILPYPLSYGWDLNAYGIGYDSSLDDYKVLKVPSENMNGMRTGNYIHASAVFVFALKSNSWKHIQDNFPYYVKHHPYCATFTNGGIHWLASREKFKETSIIVYFDVVGEKFGEVSLPHLRDGDNGSFDDLQLLGKKLCLAWFGSGCDKLDLWVMEEYRVRESWTKLLTVSKSEGLHNFDGPFCFMRTGIVVFMGNGEFVMYNARDQSLRRFHIGGRRRYDCYGTKITYRETLVSPGPSVAMEF